MKSENSVDMPKTDGYGRERRREERRECSLPAQIRFQANQYPCVISDVSPRGLRFASTSSVELGLGAQVTMVTEKLGAIKGEIRWTAHPRYGFQIADEDTGSPPLNAFYDSLSALQMLAGRMEFLGMDEKTSAALRDAKPFVDREMPASLDFFYDRIRENPGVRAFFSSESQIGRARDAQLRHWEEVTAGAFDERYFERVRRIGLAHARIGMEPRWYIAGYAHLTAQLAAKLVAEHWPKSRWGSSSQVEGKSVAAMLAALVKAIFLEMDISISSYFKATEEVRLKNEDEAINFERAFVGNSVGKGLASLAGKDLSFRLDENLPVAYKKLQDDFNKAVAFLDAAMKSVAETVEGVGSGMQEISAASDDLSHRTEQQAASLEQTSAALNEITEAARKTSEAVKAAEDATNKAQADARHSGEIVEKTVATMSKIAASSQEISQIIGVVDEIAFQTNLLALNAGVEAARAGDVGRGFAVVASEVRALAQRSSEAAKEIRGLIQTSSIHVNDGVEQVAEAGASLERIAKQVMAINSGMADIARTAREQATGLKEVSIAIDQMDQLTQQNAAMAEQATAAAKSAQGEARKLRALIEDFRLSPGESQARAASPPALRRAS